MTVNDHCPACGRVLIERKPLTDRQAAAFDVIQSTVDRTGVSPTMQELAAALHLRSISSASELVSSLEFKGYIRRDRGWRQGITLLVRREARAT